MTTAAVLENHRVLVSRDLRAECRAYIADNYGDEVGD